MAKSAAEEHNELKPARPALPSIAAHGQIPVISTNNDFDIIRLLAALQVAISHQYSHFGFRDTNLPIDPIIAAIEAFPGVPIFFVISGFLISRSLDGNRTRLKNYALNRFKRIYPALVFCFVFTIAVMAATGFAVLPFLATGSGMLWSLGQLSIFQFWTPDTLSSWGVGTPNGSLWTIPVEIQFYIFLPVGAAILGWMKLGSRGRSIAVLVCMCVSLASHLFISIAAKETMVGKLLHITFIPHIWLFLFGMTLYSHFERLRSFFIGRHRFLGWTLAVIVSATVYISAGRNEAIMIPHYFIVGGWVVSAAFARGKPVSRFLKGNDISYGLYIYHMPIFNSFIVMGWTSGPFAVAAIACTVIVALASWLLVEKPVLRRKHVPSPQIKSV